MIIVLSMVALIWAALTLVALTHGLALLAALTTLQAAAMATGAWLALGPRRPARILQFDAAVAGVLVASAVLYVVPGALGEDMSSGALGTMVRLAIGLSMHIGRGAPVHRAMLGALSLHAVSAGLVLGVVYVSMPAIGLSLALAIVAHKLPAGYALARSLRNDGRSVATVAIPACAVGLASLPVALAGAAPTIAHGLLFGVASGLFLAVGVSFIVHLPWHRAVLAGTLTQMALGAGVVIALNAGLRGVI